MPVLEPPGSRYKLSQDALLDFLGICGYDGKQVCRVEINAWGDSVATLFLLDENGKRVISEDGEELVTYESRFEWKYGIPNR